MYRNTGTDRTPSYGDFHYLQAGGQDAQVPITGCVSFVPQFVDFNGDGRTDLVTGSYPGDIYFYARNTDGGFDAPVLQRDVDGNPVHPRAKFRETVHDISSITVELHDMDADEHGLYDGTFMIEAIIDASGIEQVGDGMIVADVRYQRCTRRAAFPYSRMIGSNYPSSCRPDLRFGLPARAHEHRARPPAMNTPVGHGSSRIRRPRKSIGEPSLSNARYPVAGEHWFPPETSTPFTQSRTSPLMARM